MKHCDESMPTMVAGSLLGLDVDGVLEVTYSYPFPLPRTDASPALEEGEEELDGQEYQIEMMRMLRDVNIDNNCVGWYQSTLVGTMHTNEIVGYQYTYQASEELSDNSVVIIYDPEQSQHGTLVIKAFRLSDEYMAQRRSKTNSFLPSSNIMVELPLRIKNEGHISAYLRCLADTHESIQDARFSSLVMSLSDATVERHLELMNSWMEDLLQEQHRFQAYSHNSSKTRQENVRQLASIAAQNIERAENGEELIKVSMRDLKPLPEPPALVDPLLAIGQLDRYCEQLSEHINLNSKKMYLASQLSSM